MNIMNPINEYFSQNEKISSINEYVSHSESISLIKEYLLSKKNQKLTDKKTPKLESWEACNGTQYIPANIMYQYIIDALEINRLSVEDILKDFEDRKSYQVHAAYTDKRLKSYTPFENTLEEILEQSVYANKLDTILWTLFENYLPIFLEIQEETKQ